MRPGLDRAAPIRRASIENAPGSVGLLRLPLSLTKTSGWPGSTSILRTMQYAGAEPAVNEPYEPRPAVWIELFDWAGGTPTSEWHKWYDTMVLEPRVALSGVIAGRRGTRLVGTVDEIAAYDLRDSGVLESPEWLAIAAEAHEASSDHAGRYRSADALAYRQIRTNLGGDYEPRHEAGVFHGAFFQVADKDQADFHAWYDDEHSAFTLSVPGYLNSRRFQAVDDPTWFIGLYDVVSPKGPKLKETFELDNSPWSQRVREAALFREKRVFTVDRLVNGPEG